MNERYFKFKAKVFKEAKEYEDFYLLRDRGGRLRYSWPHFSERYQQERDWKVDWFRASYYGRMRRIKSGGLRSSRFIDYAFDRFFGTTPYGALVHKLMQPTASAESA